MGLNRGKRGYEKDGVRAKTVPAIFTRLNLEGKLAAYVPHGNTMVDAAPRTNHRVVTTVLYDTLREHRMIIRWLIQCRKPVTGLSPRCSIARGG